MSRIRVLLTIIMCARQGAENLVYGVSTRMDKNRFSVSVCTIDRPPDETTAQTICEELNSKGVKTLSVDKTPGNRSYRALLKLVKIIKRERPHVAHGFCVMPSSYGRAAAALAGVPIILSGLQNTGWAGGRKERLKTKLQERLLGGKTDCYTVCSKAVREWAECGIGIPGRKIHLIYNGIEPRRFLLDRTAKVHGRAKLLRELNLPEDSVISLSLAKLEPQKGLLNLVIAAGALCKIYPKLFFLIAGYGSLRASLEESIAAAGLKHRVILLGSRSDVRDLLASSDLFAMPSLWEGFGIALVEALAAGVPVVASAIDGMKEIVTPGVHGLLVKTGNVDDLVRGISWTLDHMTEARNMARVGQEMVRDKFDINKITRQYERLYLELYERKVRRKKK